MKDKWLDEEGCECKEWEILNVWYPNIAKRFHFCPFCGYDMVEGINLN